MNFVETPSTSTNITMIIFVTMLFIANFWLCRAMTIKLVAAGFIRKHPVVKVVNKKGNLRLAINTKATTENFQKLFLFWFIPVLGILSLGALYISAAMTVTIKKNAPKLFLKHI